MPLRPQNGIDLLSQKITNVADPTNPQDAATKNYTDAIARGLDWHGHARVLGVTNVTVSAPGAVINGVTMAAGDRALLTANTTASENGLWVWNGATAALTRPTDYTGTYANPAVTVLVTEGSSQANTSWTLSTDGTVTVGTTATAWVQVGGSTIYTGSNGVQVTGLNVTGVAQAGGGVTVGASGFAVDPTVVARKYAANLAAATAGSSQTVTHNLGTLDVQVAVVEVSSGQDVEPDVIRNGVNTVTVLFAQAIAAGQFRVSVIG